LSLRDGEGSGSVGGNEPDRSGRLCGHIGERRMSGSASRNRRCKYHSGGTAGCDRGERATSEDCRCFQQDEEIHTADYFRQLVVAIEATPTFFGSLGELEDHGERSLA